jgi:hypothetical protein
MAFDFKGSLKRKEGGLEILTQLAVCHATLGCRQIIPPSHHTASDSAGMLYMCPHNAI